MERDNHRTLQSKGELSEETSQAYERQRKSYEKLSSSAQVYALIYNCYLFMTLV